MNTAEDLCLIRQRLDRLEAQNRWLKRSVVGLILTVGLVCLIAAQGADQKKVIEAEQFVVRSPDGQRRAILGYDKPYPSWDKPQPGLYLFDEESSPRIVAFANKAGANLFLEEGGQTRLGLATTKDKFAGLVIYRSRRSARARSACFTRTTASPRCCSTTPTAGRGPA